MRGERYQKGDMHKKPLAPRPVESCRRAGQKAKAARAFAKHKPLIKDPWGRA